MCEASRIQVFSEAHHKVRVLFASASPLGGIRTYLKYVLARLDPEIFRVVLIAGRNSETADLFKALPGHISVRMVDSKVSFVAKVTSEILSFKPHVVNSQGFMSAVLCSLPCLLTRRAKHALTIHGIVEERYLAGSLKFLKTLIWILTIASVDVFIGVGRDILAHAREKLGPWAQKQSRWTVIQNGIDTVQFTIDRKQARSKLLEFLGLPEEVFLFGFFGRFMPQKGFDIIIQAMELLKNQPRAGSIRIVAVGSGDYVRESKAAVQRAGLESYFIFLPRKESVSDMIAGVDCVLMPSRWEAYGLVAAEVLCAGTPLIASNCIGLKEVVQDTPAVLIPMEDPEGLAVAMTEVSSEPEIFERTEAYRETARARYDVKRTVESLAGLFIDLASLG